MSLKDDAPTKIRKFKNKRHIESWEEYDKLENDIVKQRFLKQEPTIKGTVRITAGKVRNIQINIPRNTRPLTDRMKVSTFDMLGPDIFNRTVLDLFAGSGSFGLEALSRGAKWCTFVDAAKLAASILEKNVRKTGFITETEVIRAKATDYIIVATGEQKVFDLIFVDPPYKQFNTKHLLQIESLINSLKELLPGLAPHLTKRPKFKGVIIVKHPRQYPIEKLNLPQLKIADTAEYGLNAITYLIVG